MEEMTGKEWLQKNVEGIFKTAKLYEAVRKMIQK